MCYSPDFNAGSETRGEEKAGEVELREEGSAVEEMHKDKQIELVKTYTYKC